MTQRSLSRYQKLGILFAYYKCVTQNSEEEENYLLFNFRKRDGIHNMFLRREEERANNVLIQRHLVDDDTKFCEYFRVTREQFSFLLSLIEHKLKVNPSNRVSKPITPAEKLGVTLRFLATGESFRSLQFSHRMSASTISTFIPPVLKALKETLVSTFLPHPDQIDWEEKAKEFRDLWTFPNAVATINGKHVRIVSPNNSGSLFFNYKGYFSIVLLAMVDARYRFLIVDVGSYGKEGDAGIFKKSKMGEIVKRGSIFPPPHILPNSNILLPHVIVGDEAFQLDEHMMKPYCKRQAIEDWQKRTFNYHLCKARRVSENAFGILCNTFRVFFTPIDIKPETVDSLIIVCCCLHNLMREHSILLSSSEKSADVRELNFEPPTNNMVPLTGVGGFAKSEGFQVRSRFTEYFSRFNILNSS